jgi:putative transposase
MHPVRKRQRKLNYDYSQDNLYFVTGNVKDFECCLGNVKNGILHLNEQGKIVENQINWLEENYKYVVIHASVVMPNHFHFVLEINSKLVNADVKIKSLSQLVGAFKTTSSKWIHLNGNKNFTWHRSFYDHIIREDKSYHNICNYIEDNPAKWEKDTFFVKI